MQLSTAHARKCFSYNKVLFSQPTMTFCILQAYFRWVLNVYCQSSHRLCVLLNETECHVVTGHYLCHPLLYIYGKVMNLPVVNAVLFPVNSGSALGCGLLVECKHCHIVGCLLHKIIQYKPSSLCAGTYCFWATFHTVLVHYSLALCLPFDPASKANCWLAVLKCSPLPDGHFSLCPPVAFDLCQWSMCVFYAVLCTCCSSKPLQERFENAP